MPGKSKDIQYYVGVGRRKEAVAQVRLYIGRKDKVTSLKGFKIKTGEIFVNNKPIQKVFPSEAERFRYLAPLNLTDSIGRFGISIVVKGGGKTGQLEAVIHGLSRALESVNKENFRPILKKQGLLTRDARVKERRKVGTGGKARRAKQSPKR